ncbi:MAG: histidine phosphatase family protein, partial [Proteobacteria bacterium]|nr:histidine phosphatase family protein [Pseudomonadota bacterium]
MFDLILMRHAKSDWHSHTADIDRPLNSRGVEDATRMGAHLS